jgi:hypothetical protein
LASVVLQRRNRLTEGFGQVHLIQNDQAVVRDETLMKWLHSIADTIPTA